MVKLDQTKKEEAIKFLVESVEKLKTTLTQYKKVCK